MIPMMNEPALTQTQAPSAKASVPAFVTTKNERIAALLMYVVAFLYARAVTERFLLPFNECLLLTGAGIVGLTELLCHDRRSSWESRVWLGCFALCTVSQSFCSIGVGTVWEPFQRYLFIHAFCVWWILSRSGVLLEGKSGHLLPADVLNGLFRFPFPHFFTRIRTAFDALRGLRKRENPDKKRLWSTILAAAVCLVLFGLAVRLLADADDGFGELLWNFRLSWNIDLGEFWFHLILSLPVGAWLFGLMDGALRCPEEELARQCGSISESLQRLRRVPVTLWVVVTAAFSALYLVFFIMQGSYLFGAFTRTLPEGFVVAEYARQGFFELCRVIAVNFTLLWMVTRLAEEERRENRLFTVICVVLLTESMLFAVIAFSKIALYISCFGFTAKRVQSIWLVCVLFLGCVLWTVELLTDKPVFRKWMIASAVSLSILTLI